MAPVSELTASVVIATRNRPEQVERLLEGLASQRDAGEFEVVVVDDGSDNRTQVSLRHLEARPWPFVLKLLYLRTGRGPAAARNVGWRAARSNLVCFIDDDCVPAPAWLARLTAATALAEIVQGRTEPNPTQQHRRGPFGRTMEVVWEEGYYETCNIAYPKALLERVQGFDERFRGAINGEDVDLAWRSIEQGATTTFAPEALVWHEVWPSNYRACLREVWRRRGMPLMYQRHPQLRQRVGIGLFLRRTHKPALALVSSAGWWSRRPSSAARAAAVGSTALWYAWQVRRTRPKPSRRRQWLTVVPMALIIDLWEITVLAGASARYRCLVL